MTLQTTEVTQPGIAVSPDGGSVIFSLLGHLFQVATAGGEARQLTFGFSFDSEPALSPDGQRVAYVSDRDGSGGNVFVLDLASQKSMQLTHETQASHPTWSPDGKAIAYFRRLLREDHPPELLGFGGPTLLELRVVSSSGGQPRVVADPNVFGTAFFMPDGRLGWTLPEPGSEGGMSPSARTTRIEARSLEGPVSLLGAVKDDLENAVLGPKGDRIYYSTAKNLKVFRFDAEQSVDLAPLTDGPAQVAVAPDGSALFCGDGGYLWRSRLPDGPPERIGFHAAVTLVLRKQVESQWTPPLPSAPPRAVLSPQISPDRRRLVFMAAGFLYEQPLDGQRAHRLFEGGGFERDPAFSPDGRKLAFVVSENGQRELRVHDFASRETRTLYAVGGASWPMTPSWSPDGTRIVFQRSDGLSAPYQLIGVNLVDAKSEVLAQADGAWTARPHFSPDGQSLLFTARRDKVAALYRLALQPDAKWEAVTALTRHLNDALVSPNGKWLAFRRNTEVWIAPIDAMPIRDAHLRRITSDCSRSFTFTPDSSAIVYSSGNRVWRQPVAGGERIALPIRLTLQRPAQSPLLVRRVRVADLDAGRFGDEATILIQDGRIARIGSEQEHAAPAGALVLDGGGRYAIPGLSDVHVHAAWANQQTSEDAFIAFGITSVRDVGGSLDLLLAIRDRSDRTDLPVPRYFLSGEIFEGAMPMWGDAFLQIGTPDEARLTVRKWKEWGSDFIKVYPSLPWHLQNIVADEAERQGLPLVGHAISFEELVRHVVQGYASVEHATGVLHEDGRRLMAAAGTRWIATLTCEGGSELFMHEEPARLSSELIREFVPPDKMRAALGGGRLSYYPKPMQRANMSSSLARVYAAYGDGVKVRAGTDALMTEVFFGLSLHWELEFLNQAGLSPLQALRTGTLDAAETVGAGNQLGTLSPGKLADIVLLDANPIEGIENTLRIWRVIKGGQVFDPKTLRRASSPKASKSEPPPPVDAGKAACLKCHGPFDKLNERTATKEAPSGEKTSPHRYIPHESREAIAIPDCEKCHQKHPIPPTASDRAALQKPKWDLCFSKCHHIQDFTPCKTCHPK